MKNWGSERLADDRHWCYGIPPTGNTNFTRVRQMVHHLASRAVASFLLANSSMSSNQSGESQIRKNLIEAELVDCMAVLPGQLFYSIRISTYL